MKYLLLFIVLLQLTFNVKSQSKPPNVINTAGTERRSAELILTDNVGEPFIQTVKNNLGIIPQGFLQPQTISKLGYSVSAIFQSPTCIDKEEDTFIALTLSPSVSSQTVMYFWNPPEVCPSQDCAKIENLKPGVYSVTVTIQYNIKPGLVLHDTVKPPPIVIESATTPCLIKVYKGITANGDGIDDVLQIDNIREYPDNHVSIYNRWGELLFEIKGYNDRDPARSWPTDAMVKTLTAGTYFYIVELGKAYTPVKGWVELFKD